jgi:hypothetical protein
MLPACRPYIVSSDRFRDGIRFMSITFTAHSIQAPPKCADFSRREHDDSPFCRPELVLKLYPFQPPL